MGKEEREWREKSETDSFPLASVFHPVDNFTLTEDQFSIWKWLSSNADFKTVVIFPPTTLILQKNEVR